MKMTVWMLLIHFEALFRKSPPFYTNIVSKSISSIKNRFDEIFDVFGELTPLGSEKTCRVFAPR
jgi:hypothetical protein